MVLFGGEDPSLLSAFFEKAFILVCLGGMLAYLGRTCYDARDLRVHNSDSDDDQIPTILEEEFSHSD